MTEETRLVAELAAALAVGLVFGMLYFAALWRTSRGLADAGVGLRGLWIGFLIRIAVAFAALLLAIRLGAAATHLAAAAVGFGIARHAWIRLARMHR